VTRGPMELTVVEFPGAVPGEQLAPELRRLVEADVIRIVDLVFVEKDADGDVVVFELRDREGDDSYEAFDDLVHSVEGLIADEDLDEIAADVDAGNVAAVLLVEHVWAAKLAQITRAAGGEVVWSERIPAAVADAVSAPIG
jgi:uncharacterized membrane protein